jgi:hypothetical protein
MSLSLASAGAAHAAPPPKSPTKRFPAPSAHAEPNPESDKASGDPRSAARQMAREAIALMHDNRWSEAEALLGKAYQLVPAPTVAVLHGRALEELGKLTEAAQSYEAAVSAGGEGASPAFRKAAEEGAHRLAEVRERIPKISIVLEGEHLDESRLVLIVDTRPLARDDWSKPQLLNPGEHVVAASVDGHVAVEDRVMLKERESKQVVLRLHGEPKPAAPQASPVETQVKVEPTVPSSSAKTWGFVALGLGAAGMATGITAGVVMLDSKSTLDSQCSPLCTPGSESEISRFRTARVVSAVGYGVGIVGLGVGAAILLLSPSPRAERAARMRVYGGFETVGVEGKF